MKNVISALSVVVLVFSVGSSALAKDMTSRLGIGYSDLHHVSLPSVVAKYYPSKDYAVSLSFGTDTEKNSSRFGAMGRVYRTIFDEENMIFFGGFGAGVISVENTGRADTGFDLSGFFGAEFFIPGLENLGLTFSAGLAVTSISSGVRFRTVADHPLRAGMIFYF